MELSTGYRVDPTLGVNTFTTSAWPASSNYNTYPSELRAGYYNGPDGNCGYNRSFAGFTPPNLKGMRIDYAHVTVQQYWRYAHSASTLTYLAPIGRAPASTDTWNNMPAPTEWNIANFMTTTDNQLVDFDVKAYMQARVDANQPVYGFMFYQSESPDNNSWRKFYSSRSAVYSPLLTLKYAPNIKAVTGLTASTTPSAGWYKEADRNGDGTVDTLNDRNGQGRGDVTLTWTADPNAAGYMIYAFDGASYNVVGRTVGKSATSWTSAGGGIYPTDSEISSLTTSSKNPYITASTPSDNSYIDGSATALTYPDDIAATAKGAGVVVFDGKDMYVKKWSTYPGPEQWVQFKCMGTTAAGVPIYAKGKAIKAPPATPATNTNSISGFASEGVLYDGAVTRVSNGTADLSGFVLSSIMDKSVPVTLTLTKPPLARTGGEITAATPNLGLFCADDNNIYSVGGVSGTSSIMVRVYDKSGTFVKDITYTLEGQSAYANFDGFTTDGSNFYFYEWGGTTRMTKASIASGKVVNQWHVSMQSAKRTVSVAYNKAFNIFVMGQLDTSAGIYMYCGNGVDLADSPKKLYQKVTNNPANIYYNSTNYWFRVVTYSTNEEMTVPNSSYVMPTLENRTIRVSDAAQRSFESIATVAGESLEGCLSSVTARLNSTDLAVASTGPAATLTRVYASDLAYTSAYLPAGWMFSFEENIIANTGGALYTAPDGNRYQFTKAANGAFVPPNGMVADLAYDTGGLLSSATWKLTLKNKTVKTFDGTSGKLKTVKDRQGRSATYDIGAASVTITADNGQSIVLTKSGTTLTATYSSAAGTRKFVYTISSPSLKVAAYPDSSAALERSYTMSGAKLVAIQAAGDSLAITYGATSLSAQHTAASTPAQKQTITYASTINATVKQATVERGSSAAAGGFGAGYEKSVYVLNAAQQVIWASTFTKAASEADYQGVSLRYSAENQVIGTVAPTYRNITATTATFPSKVPTPIVAGQPQIIPAPASEFFTYDGRGNLINTTNKAGGYAEYFYNADDDLIKAIDTSRAVTWLAYDNLGRLTTTEKLLSVSGQKSRSEYSYDAKSNLTEARDAISKNPDGTYQFRRVQYANFAPSGAPQKVTYKDVALSSTTAVKDLIATGVYDEFGNLTSQTTPLGTTSSAAYDIAGKQITATDPKGIVSHSAYDSVGRPTETYKTATALSGKYEWSKVTYDVSGLDILTQELAPDGTELSSQTKTFDALGREIAADSSIEKGEEEAAYDACGNLTDSTPETASVTEPTKWLETTTYDCLNRPVYANNTKLSIQGDWHAYDDYSKESYCLHYGYIYKTTRDASGNIVKVEKLGSYDLLSKPVATTTTTYSYNNQPVTVTEEVAGQPKVEYVYTYDLLGRQTSVQLTGTGQGASTTAYNTLGWILEERDFDGTKSVYTYNERGDTTKKDQDGLITTATYDSAGAITKTVADDGTAVDFSYDGIGRLTGEKHSNATATVKNITYTYDNKGRVATQTDAVSNWTRAFTYEKFGTSESAYLKTTLTDTFADGTVSKQSAEGEYFTQASITAAGGTALTTTIQRDDIKRITNYTVGSAAHTRTYNAAGLLASDNALSTGSTTYTYGEDGKLQATSYDRLGQSAAYTYSDDRSDLKTAKIGPDATDTYSYDISKNLTGIAGGSAAAQYTYDSAGRPASKKPGDPTPAIVPPPVAIEDSDVSLVYSASWTTVNVTTLSSGSSHRASAADSTLTFSYTGNNLALYGVKNTNLGSFSVSIDGGAAQTVSCVGTALAYQQKLASFTLPQGAHTVVITTLSAELVEIDRIEISKASLSATEYSIFSSLEDDDALLVYSADNWTVSSGTSYSAGSSHSSTTGGSKFTFTYTGADFAIYGATGVLYGNFTVVIDGGAAVTVTPSNTTAYQQQLAAFSLPQGTHTAVITTRQVPLKTTAGATSMISTQIGSKVDIDRIEICKKTPLVAATTYAYDKWGQRLSATTSGVKTTYTWKGTRLSGFASSDAQVSYVYDGTGQRASKTVTKAGTSTKTDYIYDGLTLLALKKTSGAQSENLTYLYGAGSTPVGGLYSSAGSATPVAFEIVSDAHGDVRELRDTSGAAFARFSYDAYGNIRSEQTFATGLITLAQAQAIAALQPLRYAGYVWDSETGLYYCSQRYYDPSVGAFISKDPIKSGGEKSAYGYCAGDPINGVDPSGLCYYIGNKWCHDNWEYYGNYIRKEDPRKAQLAAEPETRKLARSLGCKNHSQFSSQGFLQRCPNCGCYYELQNIYQGMFVYKNDVGQISYWNTRPVLALKADPDWTQVTAGAIEYFAAWTVTAAAAAGETPAAGYIVYVTTAPIKWDAKNRVIKGLFGDQNPVGLEKFGQELDRGDSWGVTKDLVEMYVIPKAQDYVKDVYKSK